MATFACIPTECVLIMFEKGAPLQLFATSKRLAANVPSPRSIAASLMRRLCPTRVLLLTGSHGKLRHLQATLEILEEKITNAESFQSLLSEVLVFACQYGCSALVDKMLRKGASSLPLALSSASGVQYDYLSDPCVTPFDTSCVSPFDFRPFACDRPKGPRLEISRPLCVELLMRGPAGLAGYVPPGAQAVRQAASKACAAGDLAKASLLLASPQMGGGWDMDESLIEACKHGRVECVRHVLVRGGWAGAQENMPIRSLCTQRAGDEDTFLEIAALLKARGADVRAGNDQLLVNACAAGFARAAGSLIEAGALVSAQDNEPLVVACERGHADVVAVLLARGADPGAMNGEPLITACCEGFRGVAQLLLAGGADAHARDGAALVGACRIGDGAQGLVRLLLLTGGADVHARNDEALVTACRVGDNALMLVRVLLDSGADVHARGGEAFVRACQAAVLARRSGHAQGLACTETVRLLLDSGADVNARGDAAFLEACAAFDLELAKLLRERGACKQPITEEEALITACTYARTPEGIAMLRWLAEEVPRGSHPLWKDMAPIRRAVSRINWPTPEIDVSVLMLLLDRASDRQAALGAALFAASGRSRGGLVMVKLLLQMGADPNTEDECMNTPLSNACRYGVISVVKLLLDKGADVNAHNGVAVQAASCRGTTKVLALLLGRGATEHSKQMAMVRACEGRWRAAVAFLLDSGGVDINCLGGAPLAGAFNMLTFSQAVDMAEFLVQRGADVRAGDSRVLVQACQSRSQEKITHLLNMGADVRAQDDMPFIAACKIRTWTVMRFLLSKGARVTGHGNEALMEACRKGEIDTVQFLVQHGADVNARGGEAMAIAVANHYAEGRPTTRLPKVLVALGANVDSKDSAAMRAACSERDVFFGAWLVKNGATTAGFEHEYVVKTLAANGTAWTAKAAAAFLRKAKDAEAHARAHTD